MGSTSDRARYNSRNAFTLVELLVVISIIGVLVGLLLPAVSGAREASRRMHCSSNLRQIGIGFHAYESALRTFPSGHLADLESLHDGRSWGWGALLLPYIEQSALSDELDRTRKSMDAIALDFHRASLLETSINVFLCPSDPGGPLSHPFRSMDLPGLGTHSTRQPGADAAGPTSNRYHVNPGNSGANLELVGKSNYVGSFGSFWNAQNSKWEDTDFSGNGIFGRNSDVGIEMIVDGSSNTLAAGERCIRNYAAVWAGSNSWSGCGFSDNQMVLGTAFYAINHPRITWNIDCEGRGAANFSSFHPGGANFVFADGSVHFVTDKIDMTTFKNLAQRNDGKTIADF